MKVKVHNPSAELEVETGPRSTTIHVNCGDTLEVAATEFFDALASEFGVADDAKRNNKELTREVKDAIKAAREHLREIRKIMAPVVKKVAEANEASEKRITEEMQKYRRLGRGSRVRA